MKICYLAVGSELLKGRITNTNLTQAGIRLRKNGFDLTRGVEIQDTRTAIWQALEAEIAENDVILMSGGLGPTADDITKKTIAEYFGVGMREDAATVQLLQGFFEKRGRVLTERNRLQASVPENCEVLLNKRGTAPGMLFRIGEKMLVSMPGVPFEMLYLLENEVIPRMQAAFSTDIYHNHILRLWGIPEASVADRITAIEDTLPHELDISYLPRLDGIWLELTLRGKDAHHLQTEMQSAVHTLSTLLKDFVYAEGTETASQMIQNKCLAQNATLAVAESATGGNIAARLVANAGASQYFKGSVTAYFTEMKTQILGVSPQLIETHSVVSSEVAAAMAENVRKRMGTTYGLATTGYITPPQKEDAGYVWIGFASDAGTFTHKETMFNDREVNLARASEAALIFMLNRMREDAQPFSSTL